MRIAVLVLLALLAVGVAACGGDGSGVKEPESRTVTAADVDPWPLTVDEVTLTCRVGAVYVKHDGTTYALNGTAQIASPTAPDLAAIRAKDPAAPQNAGVSVDALIAAGRELC